MELVLELTEGESESQVSLSGSAIGETAKITGNFAETEDSVTIGLTGSVMDLSVMINTTLTTTEESFAVAVDIDLPIEDFDVIQLRSQIGGDEEERVNASASASFPFGYYSIQGSYLLDDSVDDLLSLTLEGSVQSPSFNQSIKTGGNYKFTEDHISGEVFVWENRIYAGYYLQSGNITGEFKVDLPDTEFDLVHLKLNAIDEMPQQITVSAIIDQELHSLIISHQLDDANFTMQVSIL